MTHDGAVGLRQQAIGEALQQALAVLRRGEPQRAVTILVPTGPNSVFVRTALGLQGPSLRVWVDTPEGIVRGQAPLSLWASAVDEPPGWRRPTLRRVVRRLVESGQLGEAGRTLSRGAWLDPLSRALRRLEGHGVDAATLQAIAADASVAADVRERARLLAVIAAGLHEARVAAGFLSPAAIVEAATTSALSGDPDQLGVGAAAAPAVIVLGDRALPALTRAFLVAWLKRREVVEVRLPALPSSSPAPSLTPLGLRAALQAAHPTLPDDHVVVVAPSSSPGLAALQGGPSSSSWDDVEVARTPDDVRETTECVREVKRAIAAGVALDQIAVVLPDGAQRPALDDALRRAGIPATWLVGFPTRELLPARLLTLLLSLTRSSSSSSSSSGPTAAEVYALLLHPGLAWRAALGPAATAGRGRWRRLLSAVAGVEGLDRMRQALSRLPLPSGVDDEALQREQRARASLDESLAVLDETLTTLGRPATLGVHVRRWSGWLLRFARAGEARERLLRLLRPLEAAKGPVLDIDEARIEWDDLQAREVSRGSLTERSIRVLSPLHLIGGAFDVVCVLGLTEGRFPTATRPDPLVSDELLEAVHRHTGVALPTSADHVDAERRRFSAVVSACRRRLWLSVPRVDFAKERPLLPSTLLLDVLSVRLGRRARFADIDAHAVARGRRARSFPDHADDAIDGREHLLVRAAALRGTPPSSTSPTLGALLSAPTSRGLLQLARSLDRVAHGGTLDAFTGAIPVALLPMPGLDGSPIPARLLYDLVVDPAKVLFQVLLRARPVPRLKPWRPPLHTDAIVARARDAARALTLPAGATDAQAVAALEARLEALLDAQLVIPAGADDELLRHARRVGHDEAVAFASQALAWWQQPPLRDEVVALDDAWPWRLTQLVGRALVVGGGKAATPTLVGLVEKVEPQSFWRKEGPLALSALALRHAGRGVEAVAVMDRSRQGKPAPLDAVDGFWRGAVAKATVRARAGQFPVSSSPISSLRRYGLAAELGIVSDGDDGDHGEASGAGEGA
jgi:hypothetical protein